MVSATGRCAGTRDAVPSLWLGVTRPERPHRSKADDRVRRSEQFDLRGARSRCSSSMRRQRFGRIQPGQDVVEH